MAENFNKLKSAYEVRQGSIPNNELSQMKQTHRRLITDLSAALNLEPPTQMLTVFDDRPAPGPSLVIGGFGPPGVGSLRDQIMRRHGFGPQGPSGLGRPPGFPRSPSLRDRMGPGSSLRRGR